MVGQTLQQSWQRKLDTLFKQGAIATWMRGSEGDNTRYSVSWLEVQGTQGLDPVLRLYVHGSDRVLSDLVLTSWEVMRAKPHFIAKATFAGEPHAMMLTAAIPPELAKLMASDRESIQAWRQEAVAE